MLGVDDETVKWASVQSIHHLQYKYVDSLFYFKLLVFLPQDVQLLYDAS